MDWFMPISLGVIAFGACSLIQKVRIARKKAIMSGAVNNSMDWEEFRMMLETKLAKEARVEWLSAFADRYGAEGRIEEAQLCRDEAARLLNNKTGSPIRFKEIAF
jgi:hypothetical protein